MSKRKIVLFGGTFDPIHLGHTAVAADAAEQIGAEKIVWVPAKRSPLKGFMPKAGDDDRLKMMGLAIGGQKNFELSDYELRRPAPSYTLETVRWFQTKYGGDVLIHWLLGADSVEDLSLWHEINALIDECTLCTMYRAGCKKPDFTAFEAVWGHQRVNKLQQNIIRTPLIDISSTEVRKRLAAGADVGKMLHPAVIEYIRRRGLYRSEEESGYV
ncbi:MAG: nicotinate (nicotinamide) nucleotide adenylyltransferase [Phycisphaerales bacterium]|nr:MAG: nicotinate (nicotinamide) nucleotide adenylyltransferase [Phycisphaerales bacterium]